VGQRRGFPGILAALGLVGLGNKMAPALGELGVMWKAAAPGIADAMRLSVKSWKTGSDFLAYDKLSSGLHSQKDADDGIGEYRAGHWRAAETLLTKMDDQRITPYACANAILAMIQGQENQPDKARVSLIKARTHVDLHWPPKKYDDGGPWFEWLMARQLLCGWPGIPDRPREKRSLPTSADSAFVGEPKA